MTWRVLNSRLLLACGTLLLLALALAFSLDATRWRLLLIGRKFRGAVPELTWRELGHMIGPGSRYYYLKPIITEGRSVNAAIENPFDSKADEERGEQIYRTRCGVCHRSDAGGKGPSLSRANLTHGDSDWALYKTIESGLPGSAMPASGLHEREIWQVIAHLRKLRGEAVRSAQSELTSDIRINISREDLIGSSSHLDAWLTYSRTYDGWRYSQLDQLTRANVGKLRLLWVRQLQTSDTVIEATPLVADGTIFLTEPPSGAVALDAAIGRVLWQTTRDFPSKLALCCGRVNRGLAILGNKLYMGTVDAHVIALRAADGKVAWDVRIANAADGYSITGAPLALNDLVVTGVAGGEFGIRGFLVAHDAETGKERWRFDTVPGPGQAGHETWTGDSWKEGGAPTWLTGTYDPALDVIYWGVGNPSPVYSGDVRKGDNLYSDSVVALNARTGKLLWHFQFTPHDEHDWDANQTPILTDLTLDGRVRKVICWANRNGFYYILDRITGEFLHGSAFVKQTWASGLDARGRPIEAPGGRPSSAGALVFPGIAGATNWQSPAYSPEAGLMFVPVTEGGSVFTKSEPRTREPGEIFVASGSSGEDIVPMVRALDAATGQGRWSYSPPRARGVGGRSGLLATAGGLVFGANEGQLFALDAGSGSELWHIDLGGYTATPPITFTVAGHQVLLVVAGRALFLFGL